MKPITQDLLDMLERMIQDPGITKGVRELLKKKKKKWEGEFEGGKE